jgi:hypothetical protein
MEKLFSICCGAIQEEENPNYCYECDNSAKFVNFKEYSNIERQREKEEREMEEYARDIEETENYINRQFSKGTF